MQELSDHLFNIVQPSNYNETITLLNNIVRPLYNLSLNLVLNLLSKTRRQEGSTINSSLPSQHLAVIL